MAASALTAVMMAVQPDQEYEIWPMDTSLPQIPNLYTAIQGLDKKLLLFILSSCGIGKMNGNKYMPDCKILSEATSLMAYIAGEAPISLQAHTSRLRCSDVQRYFIKVVKSENNGRLGRKRERVGNNTEFVRPFLDLAYWNRKQNEMYTSKIDAPSTPTVVQTAKKVKAKGFHIKIVQQKVHPKSKQSYNVGSHCAIISNRMHKKYKDNAKMMKTTKEELNHLNKIKLSNEDLISRNQLLKAENTKLMLEVIYAAQMVDNLKTTNEQLTNAINAVQIENASLKNEVRANAEAAKLGNTILCKMVEATKAPITPIASVMYMTAWSQMPKLSACALSQGIPLIIAGFLADLGIFDMIPDVAGGISKLCPSPNTIHNISDLQKERGYQIIAEIFNAGIPCALGQDKGLRNNISRLCMELAHRDPETGCPKALRLGCDGSNGSSEDVAKAIEFVLKKCISNFANENVNVNLVGMSTDSGGGGVGHSVIEACRKRDLISTFVMYWLPCIMHAINRALQVACENQFGGGGRGNVNPIQLAHTVWTIQQSLGEDFPALWKLFVNGSENDAEDMIERMMKPLLTRWGHVTQALESIFVRWDDWVVFMSKLWTALNGSNHDMAGYCIGSMIDLKMKCEVCFIVTFAREFFNEMFAWLHKTDMRTKLDGHKAHEVPLRVPVMRVLLMKLRNQLEDEDGPFKEFLEMSKDLPSDTFEGNKKVKSGKETMLEQAKNFFSDFLTTFDSNVEEWEKSLLPFIISSSNTVAAKMFAQIYIIGKIDDDLKTDTNICKDCDAHKADLTANQWAEALETWSVLEVKDPVLERHREAVEMISNGHLLYESEEPAIKNLLFDIQSYQWINKSHTQAIERLVQLASIITENQKSEQDSVALFIWTGLSKKPVDDIIQEHLLTHRKVANQHMSSGVGDGRECKTAQSKKQLTKRQKQGTSHRSRVTATTYRAKIQIEQAVTLCPTAEELKATKKIAKEKRMSKTKTTAVLRQTDSLLKAKKGIDANEAKKAAGKQHRDPSTIKTKHVDVQMRHQTAIKITRFNQIATRPYLLKELQVRNIDLSDVVGGKEPNQGTLRALLIKFEIKKRLGSGETFDARGYEEMISIGELMKILRKSNDKEMVDILHQDNVSSDAIKTILDLTSKSKNN